MNKPILTAILSLAVAVGATGYALACSTKSEPDLPLFDGEYKVQGVGISMNMDGMPIAHLNILDRHGQLCYMIIYAPPYEESCVNRLALEYYKENVAEMPILKETKCKKASLERFRQVLLQKKERAIAEKKEQIAKSKQLATETKEPIEHNQNDLYNQMDSLFGKKLGDVVSDKCDTLDFLSGGIVFDGHEGLFMPKEYFSFFNKYKVTVTPQSHKIASIYATCDPSLLKTLSDGTPDTEYIIDVAKRAVEEKFSTKMVYDKTTKYYSIVATNGDAKRIIALCTNDEGKIYLGLVDSKIYELYLKELEAEKNKDASTASGAL